MNKVLMLVRQPEPYHQLFYNEAKLLRINLVIATFDQLSFSFSAHKVEGFVDNIDLTSFKHIHIRSIGTNFETLAILVKFCQDKKIDLIDKDLLKNADWNKSKGFEHFVMVQAGLTSIDTIFTSEKSFKKYWQNQVNYPCVVKTTTGNEGKEVFLCKNKSDILKVIESYPQRILIQPFIICDFDVRVLIINNQVVTAIKRQAKEKTEFKHNVALGANFELFSLPKSARDLALKVVKTFNLSISGVDLIFDKQCNEWRIIEVNRGPKFFGTMTASGINIPQKIVSFISQ